ncbi:MAG: hemin ABC transporter substrate-binding protein [Verrucomicrobia bacterium]|nr:MAG: hemin ABC transporter substrate-binding protein [Verrucomicrobiota bacterium]
MAKGIRKIVKNSAINAPSLPWGITILGALIWLVGIACSLAQAEEPRIVSIGGAVTEIVSALGAGKNLVGVDTSSLYPEAVTKLPQIGYQRTLSAEGVLSLRPTLILASEEAGPPRVVEQLRESGIHWETIHGANSVEGAKTKIRTIARILHFEPQGEILIRHLEEEMAKVHPVRASKNGRKRVLFVFAHGGGTFLAAGRGTAADAMISLAGATNAITAYEGYKPLTAESILTAMPDTILVGKLEGSTPKEVENLLSQPGLAQTPAGKSRHVVIMDTLLLLGFGPRLGEALQQLILSL